MFVVETDARHYGIGAVLLLLQNDGKLHPVAYASCLLAPGEQTCGITELETFVVVWAVTHF